MFEIGVELVRGGVTGSAGAVTPRTAGLDHEVGDDPVELELVVEALTDQFLEIGDDLGSLVVVKLELDGAAIGHDFGHFHSRVSFPITLSS
jgi:hypothetical protein